MKRKMNKDGFSLVEMVVAMAILSIFIPVMAGMMMSATKARNVAVDISQNTNSVAAISTVLENDIKRSGSFKSYSAGSNIHTVRMAKADGTCVAWRVSGGKMQRAEVDGTKLTAAWPDITWANQPVYAESANLTESGTIFTWVDGVRNQGKLEYKVLLGDKKSGSIVQSVIEPEVAINGQGYCW